MSETASCSRNYKDSVFVDLFSTDEKAKERFLSLYNTLHNKTLPIHCPVEQLKLDNVIYRGLMNDVSYLVDNKIIVLAEHQSTINENMPLRCLEYVARLYEKLQNPSDRYLRKLSKIPTPEFYVFYNGRENYPQQTTLKLSDAFSTKKEPVQLELIVQVFNINKNKGAAVVSHCKALNEYSLFVEEVRVQKQLDNENGFTNAVKQCIEKGILKEYLERKAREVINMLIAEYDYDTDIAVQRAEEHRIAFAEGIIQGKQEGIIQGKQEGIIQGKQEGIIQGFCDGVRQTAKLMKQSNCDTDFIVKITGLSKLEIEQL